MTKKMEMWQMRVALAQAQMTDPLQGEKDKEVAHGVQNDDIGAHVQTSVAKVSGILAQHRQSQPSSGTQSHASVARAGLPQEELTEVLRIAASHFAKLAPSSGGATPAPNSGMVAQNELAAEVAGARISGSAEGAMPDAKRRRLMMLREAAAKRAAPGGSAEHKVSGGSAEQKVLAAHNAEEVGAARDAAQAITAEEMAAAVDQVGAGDAEEKARILRAVSLIMASRSVGTAESNEAPKEDARPAGAAEIVEETRGDRAAYFPFSRCQ